MLLFSQYSPYDSRQDAIWLYHPLQKSPPKRFFYRTGCTSGFPIAAIPLPPDQLAERYVKPGNRVLDFGCGPGFFTREFAKRVGDTGMVLAVDVQEEMLRILREKLGPEGLLPRIKTLRCDPDSLALSPEHDGKINAAFTIFVVHEVPDAAKLFQEISTLLVPGGLLFISEPPIIVSGKEFRYTLSLAQEAGLQLVERRLFFVNRAAVLRKEG